MTQPLRLSLVALASVCLVVGAATASAQSDEPRLLFDAGIDGNEAASVGPIENCIEVSADDEFQMDLVIRSVEDLLAWEAYVEYDPEVIQVSEQDVKLFQETTSGAVIDLSDRVPDDSGFHKLSGVDASDPPTPDSGTGVLARITFLAAGPGVTEVFVSSLDIDGDGRPDRYTLLRDSDAGIIGDSDEDGIFDGETDGAFVAVDEDCPDGTIVAQAAVPPTPDPEDSSFPWVIVAGGAAGAAILLGGLIALLLLRGGHRRPAA